MATSILAAQQETRPGCYQLPEKDRQAIISQSPHGKRMKKIAEQHAEFVAEHGDEFGQKQA